ncbi:histidine--tRNA ligase [Pelagicoccus sp. SDUM812002]|uniref:histidine--tRNA ligase n=1 Tax=Pelagicoccus sp. SDUM812002 TaxID=3041266 RepID=UPI00280EDCA5|nr:histidine--tRNA ligase [Pelagicoccus sp. SDUM812002]MDQ8185061.1 histidine--tRNA ligase [Pelagicoccus sp. SDUM812002]
MATFKTLPGFREFYPEDYAQRKHIFQIWRQVARRFAFQEFDGPILESLELFTTKSGPEIESQLFCFEDKGGRQVSLRPELTPSLARMVASRANGLKRPIKWFSIGDNFRYERMQKGRLRCFTQLNVDLLGEQGPSAEVELIGLLVQTLVGFGLTEEDFYVRLSDRNLWMLYLAALGYEGDAIGSILGVVDKWERLPEEKLIGQLQEVAGEKAAELKASVDAFLKLDSVGAIRDCFASLEAVESASEELATRLADWNVVLEGLAAMGFGGFIKIDLSIVRGLAYYTGFVFEAFDKKGEFRALAGGGRYDALVKKMGGPDMPAVGFGMGDVVLGELLKARGKMPEFIDTVDFFAVTGGDAEKLAALSDVSLLRQAGYSVEYQLKSQAFGKQLKSAASSGARFSLIYGSDELEKGVVKLRNLADRREQDIPRAQLLEAVRELV